MCELFLAAVVTSLMMKCNFKVTHMLLFIVDAWVESYKIDPNFKEPIPNFVHKVCKYLLLQLTSHCFSGK